MLHLALVLHAHLPFVRHPEHAQSHEEKWFFEALAECYLPLIGMLGRLEADSVPYGLSLSISPTLACMMADEFLKARFETYLSNQLGLIQQLLKRPDFSPFVEALSHQMNRLSEAAKIFQEINRDILHAFVRIADAGRLELLTTSISHAYLPGLTPIRKAIAEQIRAGVLGFERFTQKKTLGFWLPECGYLEALNAPLREAQIRYTVVDSHAFDYSSPRTPFGTFFPITDASGLIFFARDGRATSDIWSHTTGYPAHPNYREFYRDIGFDLPQDALLELGLGPDRHMTGIKLFRVTGQDSKSPYQPKQALEQAEKHASDFLEKRTETARLASHVPVPVSVPCFDAELFGHWWLEGVAFLEALFRQAANHPAVRTTTLKTHLQRCKSLPVASPSASSWGKGGYSSVWFGQEAAPYWKILHKRRREVDRAAEQGAISCQSLAVAKTELFLLEASDWLFMITQRDCADYARKRIAEHSENIQKILKPGTEPFARALATKRGRFAELIVALQGAQKT